MGTLSIFLKGLFIFNISIFAFCKKSFVCKFIISIIYLLSLLCKNLFFHITLSCFFIEKVDLNFSKEFVEICSIYNI